MRIAVLGAILAAGLAFARPLALSALHALVAIWFRDVPTIDTAALARLLDERRAPLLLDVRSAGEFAVSHLPGARHALEPDTARWITTLPRSTPIVVYCSLGWRSAEMARSLRAQGFTTVRNLEGSAWAWADEGRPLQGSFGPQGKVHPYDPAFAWLVRAEARGPAW